jgi:hypothetical protein
VDKNKAGLGRALSLLVGLMRLAVAGMQFRYLPRLGVELAAVVDRVPALGRHVCHVWMLGRVKKGEGSKHAHSAGGS